MKEETLDDFPIGCSVKIIGPIPEKMQWWFDEYMGEIGTVVEQDGKNSVVVGFGPCSEPNGVLVDIAWLERGRVEWIPE